MRTAVIFLDQARVCVTAEIPNLSSIRLIIFYVQVVLSEAEKKDVLHTFHNDVTSGGHYGQNATMVKITERFWWKNVANDVRDHVRCCPRCQLANVDNRPSPAVLHPIPIKDLFHRWGIDLVGPLNTTKAGNTYLIVATEYLTRWAEVDAIHDKSADSVHKFLLRLLYRFRACKVLLHDQGREFNNNLVSDLCDRVGTEQAMTSAYHPQVCHFYVYCHIHHVTAINKPKPINRLCLS